MSRLNIFSLKKKKPKNKKQNKLTTELEEIVIPQETAEGWVEDPCGKPC